MASVSEIITDEAAQLRARHSLRTPDAIRIATAIAHDRFRLLQPHLEDHRPLKAVAAPGKNPVPKRSTRGVIVSAVWPDRPRAQEANRHLPAGRRHRTTEAADSSCSDLPSSEAAGAKFYAK